MGSPYERPAASSVQQRDLWQRYYQEGFAVGTWFILEDAKTEFGPADSPKSRPWVVARKQLLDFGVVAFSRSTSTANGLWHRAHVHSVPSCVVNREGWIKVHDPQTLPADLFEAGSYSCEEPDEIVRRLVTAAPHPDGVATEEQL